MAKRSAAFALLLAACASSNPTPQLEVVNSYEEHTVEGTCFVTYLAAAIAEERSSGADASDLRVYSEAFHKLAIRLYGLPPKPIDEEIFASSPELSKDDIGELHMVCKEVGMNYPETMDLDFKP